MDVVVFAQVNEVDASFLKQAVLLVIGLLGGAASVMAIAGYFRRNKRVIEPQPFEVKEAPEFVTAGVCLEHKEAIERRLGQHDRQIEELWTTMRAEDAAIRALMAKSLADIERSLGRIEGKLDRRNYE
jgi:hypothetical protein